MDERYTGEIEQASQLFAEALLAREKGLEGQQVAAECLSSHRQSQE